MSSSLVVRTKLISPRLPQRLLHRPHINSMLMQGLDVPLVLVHAGAGYGKSTALAAFIDEQSKPAAWYALSESDTDPLVFGSHLIAAVESIAPGVEGNLSSLVNQASRGDLPWVLVCDALNNQLFEHLSGDAWLVLDDVHAGVQSEDVARLLNRFLSHQPPQLHVVLSTRRRLGLPAVTQAIAKGNAVELREPELALTPAEIQVFFTDHHTISLTSEQAECLHHETEGWVIALQLLGHKLQDLPPPQVTEALADLPGHFDALFEFLAQSVINRQPRDIQTFLVRTAILRQLTPAACDAVLRTDTADSQRRTGSDLLARLRDTGLGLVQVDDRAYRHHHLIREYLQQQLSDDSRQWRTLHRRAAAYFARIGNQEESIYHLLEAGDFEAAAHRMSTSADRLLQAGRFGTLAGWLSALPDDVMAEWPDLYVVQGDVARLTSRYDAALAAYQQAEAIYDDQNDALGRSQALEGQGLVFIDTVRPAQAETYLKQALKAVGQQHRRESGRLLRLLAENATNQGQLGLAARWYEAAQRLDAETNLELEVRIRLRSGRLTEARALLMPAVSDGDNRRPARTHREPSLLLALLQTLQGDVEAARRGANAGLQIAQRLQSPFTEAVAHMRLGHAWQLPPRADVEKAKQHYEEALHGVRQLDVRRGEAEPLFGLTLLYAFAGNPQAAEQAATRGLRIADAAGDAWVAGLLQLALGISRSKHADYDHARDTLVTAHDLLMRCDDRHGTALAHLWLTWLGYQHGNDELFETHAWRWLAQAETYSQHVTHATLFSFRDAEQAIRLLIDARKRSIRVDVVERLLQQLDLPANLSYHPGYTLRVKTLGDFAVWRGESAIQASEWQRTNARDLFKLLLVHRGQFLQREQFIEWLCPELDLETGENHFKVALSALNRALEPNRPRSESPFFVERRGTRYGFNPAAAIELDVEAFEAGIAAAESLAEEQPQQAIDTYRRALAKYEGSFLPACRYEDWAIRTRERLRMRFLYAAEALAHLLLRDNRASEAVEWCRRILDVDPCWEPAYRIAMRAHVARGQRHLATRTYERCVETLERELDLSPMPETTQLYHSLVRSASSVTDL